MTLVQLVARLVGRYLDPGDLNLLPADGQLAVCDAINTATTEWYDLAPPIYRRGTLSFTLPAPAVVSGVAVTQGSPTLGAAVFTNDQRGCTVLLDGDPNPNRVEGPDSLLDAYLGTASTVQARVYSDAALFGSGVFASLVGEPLLLRADNSHPLALTRDDRLQDRSQHRCRIGRPDSYTIGPVALPGASGDLFALFVHPLPEVACVVRVDADLRPLQFTIDDLTRSVDLPVPEHHCLPILLPLAAAALADHAARYWRQGATVPDDSAARERLRNLPRDFGTPEHAIGTPIGW